MPQAGRFASQVLGLDLALDGTRLRFFAGTALLEDADEMIARLGSMLNKVIVGQEELAGRLAEEQRLRENAEEQLATAETRGKAAAILAFLAARGIVVGADVRARIEACRDASTLDRWIVRAATATSAEEVVATA